MDARRRQILEDLGIDQWRLRGAAAESVGSVPAVTVSVAAPRTSGTPASPGRAAAATAAAPGELKEAREAAGGETDAPQRVPAEAPSEAWSVLSLVSAGIVLLVDGASSRRDLRLAMDILAAASGGRRAKPSSRHFAWPPDGTGTMVGGGAGAARRAFAAFVDKELGDHGAALLLCEEPLTARLPERGGLVRVEIPPLEQLGRDVDGKRRLWETLRSAIR